MRDPLYDFPSLFCNCDICEVLELNSKSIVLFESVDFVMRHFLIRLGDSDSRLFHSFMHDQRYYHRTISNKVINIRFDRIIRTTLRLLE